MKPAERLAPHVTEFCLRPSTCGVRARGVNDTKSTASTLVLVLVPSLTKTLLLPQLTNEYLGDWVIEATDPERLDRASASLHGDDGIHTITVLLRSYFTTTLPRDNYSSNT